MYLKRSRGDDQGRGLHWRRLHGERRRLHGRRHNAERRDIDQAGLHAERGRLHGRRLHNDLARNHFGTLFREPSRVSIIILKSKSYGQAYECGSSARRYFRDSSGCIHGGLASGVSDEAEQEEGEDRFHGE